MVKENDRSIVRRRVLTPEPNYVSHAVRRYSDNVARHTRGPVAFCSFYGLLGIKEVTDIGVLEVVRHNLTEDGRSVNRPVPSRKLPESNGKFAIQGCLDSIQLLIGDSGWLVTAMKASKKLLMDTGPCSHDT